MAKSILVITDSHEKENCSLKKAHDIATPLGAKIEAVRFIKTKGSSLPEDINPEQQKQDLDSSLQEIFADYEHKDSIKSQVVVTEDIVQWVVEYCQHREFELVVKAGHRSESLFHTPCDWELIRHLHVPVLIASQEHWRNKHSVLVAVDPVAKDEEHKELNNTILQWTKTWASAFNCEVHMVYSLPVSKILKELDIIDVKEYARKHRAEGEQLMLDFLAGHDLPNVKIHVAAGAPEKTIPHCADELKAELVIMGSTGRTGLAAKLLGNVAEKVMHHLRTDSLLIELKN